MLSPYSAQNLEQQLNKVAEHGFCVMDNFLTHATVLALATEITTLHDTARMLEAGTGRTLVTVNKHLRGDSIHWLKEIDASTAQQIYFRQMEVLRLGLNQHLYLGLFALESHLALYPIGAGYKKHIDRFKDKTNNRTVDQSTRQVSCILYLNQDWIEEDGGHLRLYLNPEVATNSTPETPPLDTLQLDISPIGGRLVIFLSDTFYHEVLPTRKNRMSLTGWFLTR